MDRIRTLTHKGKKIHYFDYRGLIDDTAFLELARKASDFLIEQNKKSLHLINLTGTFITPNLIKPLITEIERYKPFIQKEAIVGVTGAKRVLFQTYLTFFSSDDIKAFRDTEEETALDWLATPPP